MLIRVILLSALATKGLAQILSSSSTAPAQTSLNLFIPPELLGAGYVGSIVRADQCGTTIGIACTSGYENTKTTVICFPTSTVFATYAGSSYGLSTLNTLGGGDATTIQTCRLDDSQAVCSTTYIVSAGGGRTTTSYTHTLSGQQMHFDQVPITAGASRLSNLAACTPTSNAAAATGVGNLYKVVVVQGAAALLAGAVI